MTKYRTSGTAIKPDRRSWVGSRVLVGAEGGVEVLRGDGEGGGLPVCVGDFESGWVVPETLRGQIGCFEDSYGVDLEGIRPD